MLLRDILGAIFGIRPVASSNDLKLHQNKFYKSALIEFLRSSSSFENRQKASTYRSKSSMSLSTQSLFLKCPLASISFLVSSSVRY